MNNQDVPENIPSDVSLGQAGAVGSMYSLYPQQ